MRPRRLFRPDGSHQYEIKRLTVDRHRNVFLTLGARQGTLLPNEIALALMAPATTASGEKTEKPVGTLTLTFVEARVLPTEEPCPDAAELFDIELLYVGVHEQKDDAITFACMMHVQCCAWANDERKNQS